MTVNQFAVEVSKLEGGVHNKSIAQIKEQLKCENKILKGELYKMIRKIVLVRV